jgi:hypothetical protein
MYADPQDVVVNTVTESLKRTGMAIDAGRFGKSDGSFTLSISHSSGRRNQHRARLDSNKIVTDPYATDRNLPVSASVYVTLDVPTVGFTIDEQEDLLVALADWLKASSHAASLAASES